MPDHAEMMKMTYSISSGVKKKPIKAVVFGPEGVGKTTFASRWPGAVFIDVEDGSGHYDVARLPIPQTWGELLDEIVWCSVSSEVGTVVIDTADRAEALCKAYILERDNKESIESYGYGKGYTILAEEFKKLTEYLDACVENGKNALVLAHAQIKKFEQPDEMGSYDRWELKLEKKCSVIPKEWCDVMLFANYRTDMMKDENGKYHATGGRRRIMYANHTSAYDAKNRLGLPDEMPFDFDEIADRIPTFATGGIVEEPVIAQPAEQPAEKPEESSAVQVAQGENIVKDLEFTDVTPPEVKQLWELMAMDQITTEQVQRAVGEGKNNPYTVDDTIGDYDRAFIREVLIAHWRDIASGIRERAEYEKPVPFD